MRKILIALLLVIALGALWLWRGRDLSMLIDRFKTIETSTQPVKTIVYEGNGTGGILHVADVALSLNETQLGDAKPNVGTTKDNQLALSFRGKIFSFGRVSPEGENLAATIPADDAATVSIKHSALSWPNFFEMNFMTGRTPSWKRHTYQRLIWQKADGAKLEMLWRYEQYFYPEDGWTSASMTREGVTGLIRVEISGASR